MIDIHTENSEISNQDSVLAETNITSAPQSVLEALTQLVAAARGVRYLTIEDVPAEAKRLNLGPSNSRKHGLLAQAALSGTRLVPWYRVDMVEQSRLRGLLPAETSIQLRPTHPREDPTTGKKIQSFVLTGGLASVDVHPATPADWIANAKNTLVFDDVADADTAMAQLLASGFESVNEITSIADYSGANTAVHALMAAVDPVDRVVMLSISGDFEKSEAWEQFRASERQVCVVLANDPGSDWATWARATTRMRFFRGRNATATYAVARAAADSESDSVNAATAWDSFAANSSAVLGEPPVRDRGTYPAGTWLVSEDGCTVEALEARGDSYESASRRLEWVTKSKLGGRVLAVRKHRAPTSAELKTGLLGEGANLETPGHSTCEITLQWVAADGATRSAGVTGPAAILAREPRDWHRAGAEIPNEVLLLSVWPPEKGRNWMAAVKGNDTIPAAEEVAWQTMGWVPTPNEPVCSFISGNTVLSLTEDGAAATRVGVTEQLLPKASKFSLPKLSLLDRDAWAERVRDDLKRMRTQFIDDSPWVDGGAAAVVIAAGLRPTVPIKTTVVLYFQGPPAAGKSWIVSIVMCFHQDGATWTNKMLPGSVKDTVAATELAIAATNIWVVDDLAPSSSLQQSQAEQGKVGDITRAIHNGTAKRRSGPDLKAREVFEPRALVMITAENPHDIASVRQRSLILNIGHGSMKSNKVEAMTDFRDFSGVPGRLTTASVQAIQLLAADIGWKPMLAILHDMRSGYRNLARDVLNAADVHGAASARAIDICVDLMMGFAALHILAERVGDTETLELLALENSQGLPARLAQFAAHAYTGDRAEEAGVALIAAIRSLCAAGKGHILNGYDPSQPPSDDAQVSRALGWQTEADGTSRPLGTTIRRLRGVSTKDTPDVIWLDQQNAFDAAQRAYPRTLPFGTAALTAFGTLWDDQLIHPHYLAKGRDGGKAVKSYFTDGRSQTGVPIHIDQLLGKRDGGEEDE